MRQLYIGVALLFICFSSLKAQQPATFTKDCSVSAGMGYGNGRGSKAGSSIFMQISYRFSPKFSLATEFDRIYFYTEISNERPPTVQINIQSEDTYYSILLKYHLPVKKLNTSIASGWSYFTRQRIFETYYNNGSSPSTWDQSTFSDLSIPFLLEAKYPVFKGFDAGVHLRYNLTSTYDGTYSASLAFGVKL